MLIRNEQVENAALEQIAGMLCVAARTAPKGKGQDLLTTAVISGVEKQALQDHMRTIYARDGVAIFNRDADNLEHAPVVVLIGTRKKPLGLPHCGFCGFADCAAMQAAGGTCSFNSGDLGIAVGSAAALAADCRVDNRIMYTVGEAVIEAQAGEVVLGPKGVPHRFENLGPGRLQTIDIHHSSRWIQTDLE